jgi:hypothetical protein
MSSDLIPCPHCGEPVFDLEHNNCFNCLMPHDHSSDHDGDCNLIYTPEDIIELNIPAHQQHKKAIVSNVENNIQLTSIGIPVNKINNLKKLEKIARKTWDPQSDYTLEEHVAKILKKAAQPPDFKPQPKTWENWDDYDDEEDSNPEVIGLPRPQWRTDPTSQHYDYRNTKPKDQPEGKEHGKRRLYQKFPVPWNTDTITGDIPQFDGDNPFANIDPKYGDEERLDLIREMAMSADDFNLTSWSRSANEQRCPMCGGQFEKNDPAVRYKGSENSEMLSDHLPYHEHCMDLVNKHCPHLRRESDYPALYEHGQYGNLIQNAQNHVRDVLKKKRQELHDDGIDVGIDIGLPEDNEGNELY